MKGERPGVSRLAPNTHISLLPTGLETGEPSKLADGDPVMRPLLSRRSLFDTVPVNPGESQAPYPEASLFLI